VLPEERDYTQALSLSRLAYDMESLLSPTLAAGLLTLVTFNWLFFGTVIGFFCSAALVVSVTIPKAPATRPRRGFYDDTTRGMRLCLATPRLRGLLALNLSVAAAGSMVFVNTVVMVKGTLGGADAAMSRSHSPASAPAPWRRPSCCHACSTGCPSEGSCSRRRECWLQR
jgi:hypothetical protein